MSHALAGSADSDVGDFVRTIGRLRGPAVAPVPVMRRMLDEIAELSAIS